MINLVVVWVDHNITEAKHTECIESAETLEFINYRIKEICSSVIIRKCI